MADHDRVPVRRALLSASDKTGLVDLARVLAARGVELISTGGTARALREDGLAVTEVADVTGFPEILDGRVKTLHPAIHGGLLARRDLAAHRDALVDHGIGPIDLLVVTLYPFEATVASGAERAACVEQIDIGGPALIRAAAKNHDFVTVLVDPEDYGAVVAQLEREDGATTLALRRQLAGVAYARTAAYDATIARWMTGESGDDAWPRRLTLAGRRVAALRYGENPHQTAALYADGSPRPGAATARQLQGKALSYNNLADADAAFELAAEFAERAAVVIVKHNNPCGVAVADTLAAAWDRALACDPVSAYGGVVAVNRALDAATATALAKLFVEVVIAPGVDEDARALLSRKSALRLLDAGAMPDPAAPGLALRMLGGGFLAQARDAGRPDPNRLQTVTARAPSAAEHADLLFAWTVCKHVTSNAIVLTRDGATVGIGAGQMSRVDAVRIAVDKARAAAAEAGESEPRTAGAVVASDAFFPFADGLVAAAEAGVTAAIHPGGSKRDEEVIGAADRRGMAMVVTGLRHFRH